MTKRHWPLSYLTIAAAAFAIASNTSVAQTNPPGTGLQADQLTQQPGASAPSDGRPGLRHGQPGSHHGQAGSHHGQSSLHHGQQPPHHGHSGAHHESPSPHHRQSAPHRGQHGSSHERSLSTSPYSGEAQGHHRNRHESRSLKGGHHHGQDQPGARPPHAGHSQHSNQAPHKHHGQHSGHAPHDDHDQHAGHASHDGHAHHGAVSSAKDAERFAALPTAPNVAVENCWVRLLPAPTPSGGYFVVKNEGDEAIVLLAAATKAFDEVMLHQTTHSDGMSRMAMVDALEIPAGETLEFAPGGYHAMFEQALEDIQVGDSIVMHFKFANKQKATAQCEIKPAGAR